MTIYGFALLRNGVMYDYPFRESLLSLAPLVKTTVMALGDSKDGTEKEIRALGVPLDIVPTVWDETVRQSGLILSQQTNIALDHLKKNYSGADNWAIYLQSDEAIHEDDHNLIVEDIRKANEQGYDAVRFHYLHFWQAYDRLAINWWWYPQEIRAIKINSTIQSYGDAQSFENCKKVYQSKARIFHYGHIREEKAYVKKYDDFHLWWHSTEDKLAKAKRKFQKRIANVKTIPYLASHPEVMAVRAGGFAYPMIENVNVVGDKERFSPDFLKKICARQVSWYKKKSHVTNIGPVVLLEGSRWEKYWDSSRVPPQHPSKIAQPWPYELWASLKFSERGVCIGHGPKPQN